MYVYIYMLALSSTSSYMLSMAWTWIVYFAVIVLTLFLRSWLKKNKHKNFPPSPRGIPILGHLHLVGKNAHQDLCKLAKKYGPIMYMRFGFVPIIIVSSPHYAEQILKTQDLVFASRPPHEAAKQISYNQRNMSFSPYGSFWRDMRKLITIELLSSLRIKSFQPMRKQELGILVESLEQAALEHVAVDLSAKVASMNADMSCLMIFGKKYKEEEFSEKGFKAVIKEGMQLAATPNLADYFPYVGKLDLQGLTRRMKVVADVFDEFFEKIIDEHGESKDQGKTKDFVDTMLSIMKSGGADFQIDRAHIKATMLDMLAASMDTSATAIDWLMADLIKHPRVMKKVQKELEEVVGLERMVEESDLEKLEYLDIVVKESFRLHPVAPLLLPHEAMEDCTIDGYHIPKKSRVMVNVWAIGRDPNVWAEPEKFFPERFVGSDIDLRGRDFQLLPFGSGRRGCPGMQLGLTMVQLVVAQLVNCFDWELPNNTSPTELDMTEEFGLVVTRANHLLAIPNYRLRKE